MYTHFGPTSAVLREKESLAGCVGEDAPAVRKFTRSERYESEVKVMHRCLSLALIKHALGDYFSLEFPWPHPSVDTEPYRELVKQPGVFIVTADVAFSKRYLKYLSKKYLKKQQLRDYLHVIASSKTTYELRYFNIHDTEGDAEDDDE